MKFAENNTFTNQYSLSKTLRFELVPVGKTEEILEEEKVFEKDEIIKKKYEATKPYFDRLHREFVEKALANAVLSDLDDYLKLFKKWKNDKEAHNKDLQKKEMTLRKEVVTFFDAQAKTWSENYANLKKKDMGILSEEAVFENILKVRYGSENETKIIDESTEESVSIFDSWKGFTGYFDKFFETRKNFYKDDGTSTALATRIIDQNLKRFCDNILIFESVKDTVDFSESNFAKSLTKIFSVDFYNSCFLQEGIDFYNKVLGGETLQNGEKKKGLNECINMYKQQTREKLSFFKELDKQILGESEKENFIDEIQDEENLKEVLQKFYAVSEAKTNNLKKLFTHFVKNNHEYDLSKTYISKEMLNTICHKWTYEYLIWTNNIAESFKENGVKLSKKKDEGYSFPDFISLNIIQRSLEKIEIEKFWKERYYDNLTLETNDAWKQFLQIFEFEFFSLFEKEIVDSKTGKNVKVGYDVFVSQMKTLLENFENTKKSKVIIKDFADSVLRIYQMAKYFALEKKRKWVGDDYELGEFYEHPDFGYKSFFYDDAYEDIVQVYNTLRNFLTKKPYSEEKWKLNFSNPTLADGWDKNKESDNFAVILKKDEKYYLALMTKGNNRIFDDRNEDKLKENIENGKYEKVVYKLLPGANKMLPKVFFSASNIDFYSPSEKVLEVRNHASHVKNGTPQKGFEKKDFSLKDCHILIDFFKKSIQKHPDWQHFDFQFSDTEKYKDISDFYREVESGGYKISFQSISEEYITEKNKKGELYLFQIKNKDWNERAKGKKNLHTLYFESLFSEENRKQNFPMKLNGQAEIFYRPKTKDLKKEKITTKSGKILEKEEKAFQKNRFTENKIFFHVPLTLNRTKPEMNQYRFNAEINTFLANNPDINIIGVDRGEKHLAYYSVINQNQEILESGTLNEIAGVDYERLLEEKAENREQARKDWQAVEGIKDLKKGYISQVVRKLADLAIKHNAIIVFEDLNMRFKQIRGGIEKSAYQQLEKALIEKLNFLVNKNEIDPKKAGYLMKAYQFTAPFTTFKEMGKQTGIIFYTQANYTSKIDPITGWRPNLYLKYSNAEKAKQDIIKFSKIEFVNSRFEFTYDLKSFITSDKVRFSKKTQWTVCSCVERFRWNRNLNNNKGGYDPYKNMTEEFQNLFEQYKIDFLRGNILEQIETLETTGNENFFKDFIFYFNLICQIRNTDEQAKDVNSQDFILSPVEPFFDSRKDNGKNLPKNGDDNGAYNIARKGIMLLQRINDFENMTDEEKNKLKYPDLFITNAEWDSFATKTDGFVSSII